MNFGNLCFVTLLLVDHMPKIYFLYHLLNFKEALPSCDHFPLSSQPMRIHNKTDLVYLDSQNLS